MLNNDDDDDDDDDDDGDGDDDDDDDDYDGTHAVGFVSREVLSTPGRRSAVTNLSH